MSVSDQVAFRMEFRDWVAELRPVHQDIITAWLRQISDSVFRKLVNAELIEARTQRVVPTLGEFLSDFLEMKSGGSQRSGGWKSNTIRNRQQSMDAMLECFGSDTELTGIDAGSAEEWLHDLTSPKPKGKGSTSSKPT